MLDELPSPSRAVACPQSATVSELTLQLNRALQVEAALSARRRTHELAVENAHREAAATIAAAQRAASVMRSMASSRTRAPISPERQPSLEVIEAAMAAPVPPTISQQATAPQQPAAIDAIVEPTQIAEPTQIVEPIQIAEPARIVEPVRVVEPLQVVEPTRVAEPVQIAEPVGPPTAAGAVATHQPSDRSELPSPTDAASSAFDAMQRVPTAQVQPNGSVTIDADAFARVFATVVVTMLDERGARPAAPLAPAPVPMPAPVKSSFWTHAKHPDVILLGLTAAIAMVVLAAWLA